MKRSIFKSRPRQGIDCSGDSRTKQSFKEACDINNIMARYRQTGLVSHLAQGQPQYLDVSDMPDFRTALDHVREVSEFFMGLPSDVRLAFENDPANFMDSLDDREVIEYLDSHGIKASKAPKTAPESSEAPKEASGDPEPDKDA